MSLLPLFQLMNLYVMFSCPCNIKRFITINLNSYTAFNYVRAWRKIFHAETIKFQDLSWNFSFQAVSTMSKRPIDVKLWYNYPEVYQKLKDTVARFSLNCWWKQLSKRGFNIQWNPDFSNLQGKRNLVRKIGSSRNRRWHQITLILAGLFKF